MLTECKPIKTSLLTMSFSLSQLLCQSNLKCIHFISMNILLPTNRIHNKNIYICVIVCPFETNTDKLYGNLLLAKMKYKYQYLNMIIMEYPVIHVCT